MSVSSESFPDSSTRPRRAYRESGAGPRNAARISDLARNFAPPDCFINHVLTPRRRFATAPLSLTDVKDVSKRLGVTINDIVLAMSAGALRQLLLRYDGKADEPLIAGVPVSTNPSTERLAGNEFTYITPSLPVHIADPLERVKVTSLATTIAKENNELLGPMILPAWMSYLPPALAPPVFRRQAQRLESASVMNLTISNVRGPRERGVIEGATVSEIYSVGPVVRGQRHEHHGVELCRPAGDLGDHRRPHARRPARSDRRDDRSVHRNPGGGGNHRRPHARSGATLPLAAAAG